MEYIIAASILIPLITLIIAYYRFNGEEKKLHPALERTASILSLSYDIKEIRHFMEDKIDYLSDESFKKLLSRIEELNADKMLDDKFSKLS